MHSIKPGAKATFIANKAPFIIATVKVVNVTRTSGYDVNCLIRFKHSDISGGASDIEDPRDEYNWTVSSYELYGVINRI